MKKGAASCVVVILVIGSYISQAAGANLTIPTAGRVTIELIFSDAAFRNTLSVNSPTVGAAISGCSLEPAGGLPGLLILSEKISQRGCRVDLDADPVTGGIQGFPANTTFEFRFCAQTDADPACEFVWSSDPTQNSDNFDHVMTTPLFPTDFPGQIFQLAWEDLENGGDQDFNDLIAVVRVQSDNDGDGLWDDWEQFGIDTNADGAIDLDLPALGADPDRQDIFLEIDYMDCSVMGGDCVMGDTHFHEPKVAAFNEVIDAFANAPVMNPDGSMGITLHVDVDDAIAHQNFLGLGCPGTTDAAFNAVKADPANFGPTNPRRFAYHYALFAHRQSATTSSSGCGEQPGNDFLVTLGEWNTICIGTGANGTLDTAPAGDDVGTSNFIFTGPNLTCNTTATGDDVQFVANGNAPANDPDGDGLEDRTVGTVQQQAGLLMHEFGHNLDLRHGGGDGDNFKPNYLSIMNYAFTSVGIPPTDPDGTGPLTARVDYSPDDLADLNENNLNEPAGIGDGTDNTRYSCPTGVQNIGAGLGAIDWNCDSDGGTDASVAVDINGDAVFGVLTGFDDWANLKLDFQNTDDFEDGVHTTTIDVIEIDFPTHLEILEGNCLGVSATEGCTVNNVPGQLCVGTPDRDVIHGTDGPDVIIGREGNDIIKGFGGDDIICGDAGGDSIKGGDGMDLIDGAEGDDNLRGGDADDELTGGPGDDSLKGNDGDDFLDGGEEDTQDRLNGGKGFDTCNDGERIKTCELVDVP